MENYLLEGRSRDESSTRKTLVYGTLLEGFGNHSWASRGMKKIVEAPFRLGGYKMYTFSDRGGYPLCCESLNDEDSIVVEMYEFFDDDVMSSVDGMEHGAGYYRKIVEVDGHECVIYLHERENLEDSEMHRIEDGDYRKFINNLRSKRYA